MQRRADCDNLVKKLPDYVSIPVERNDRMFVDFKKPKTTFAGGSLFEDVRMIDATTLSIKRATAIGEGDIIFIDSTLNKVMTITDEGHLKLQTAISSAHVAGWIADTEDPSTTMRNILEQKRKQELPASFYCAGLGGPYQEKQYYLWQNLARVTCVFEGASILTVDKDFTKHSWLSGDPVYIFFDSPTDIEYTTFCNAFPVASKSVRYELKYKKKGHVFIGWYMRMETHASCVISLERPKQVRSL